MAEWFVKLRCRVSGHKYITIFKGTKSDNVYCVRCHTNFYLI